MAKKIKRLESLLAQEIPPIVQQCLNDPRLGFITITEVEVARDMRSAIVYFSAITPNGQDPSEGKIKTYEKVLNQGAPEVQRELGGRIKLRFIPHLRFEYSDSLRKAVEMSELIRKARETDIKPVEDSGDGVE